MALPILPGGVTKNFTCHTPRFYLSRFAIQLAVTKLFLQQNFVSYGSYICTIVMCSNYSSYLVSKQGEGST